MIPTPSSCPFGPYRRVAQIYTARTFNYTPYIAATILFLVVSIPVARFTDWYTERDRRRKQAVGT